MAEPGLEPLRDSQADDNDRLDVLPADVVSAWPISTVSLGDRTYVVRRAAGASHPRAPAVMLHGLGGSSTDWTDLMWLLRNDVDAIAPDFNGFGQSPPPRDGDYSMSAQARGIAGLLEREFPGQRVHVFGNSMGGAIAVQLAARHSELVKSLTLVSPALPWLRPRRTSAGLGITAVPFVGPRLYARYAKNPAEVRVRSTMDLVFADPTVVPAQRFAASVEASQTLSRLPYAQDAFLRSLRALLATYTERGPERPWVIARRVSVPVLAIYGLQDKLVDPRSAHRISASFPNSRVLVLPHAGHVAQMEHPEEVAAAWRDLLVPALEP